jgi:hypothetical protein
MISAMFNKTKGCQKAEVQILRWKQSNEANERRATRPRSNSVAITGAITEHGRLTFVMAARRASRASCEWRGYRRR